MELFFRKYFWTVNLVFILLVAWLVARTANLFVESSIAPAPSAEPAARSPQRPQETERLASLELQLDPQATIDEELLSIQGQPVGVSVGKSARTGPVEPCATLLSIDQDCDERHFAAFLLDRVDRQLLRRAVDRRLARDRLHRRVEIATALAPHLTRRRELDLRDVRLLERVVHRERVATLRRDARALRLLRSVGTRQLEVVLEPAQGGLGGAVREGSLGAHAAVRRGRRAHGPVRHSSARSRSSFIRRAAAPTLWRSMR